MIIRLLSVITFCMCANVGYADTQQLSTKSTSTVMKKNEPTATMSQTQLMSKMKSQGRTAIKGKRSKYRQLPHEVQRAIQLAYDQQPGTQQACASAAPAINKFSSNTPAPRPTINNFANATNGGTELDCAISETIVGCWHGEDYFTGCQKVGDSWDCQWNEPIGC